MVEDHLWGARGYYKDAYYTNSFVELFRSRKYRGANGLVWWNVRDGWPIVSDAVVDYYGDRKLAYWTIRNAQRDQVVVLRDDHRLVAVNDAPRNVRGDVRVVDAETGRVVFGDAEFEIPADGVADMGTVPWQGQGVLIIEATVDGRKYLNHFLYGEPPFDFARFSKLLPYDRER